MSQHVGRRRLAALRNFAMVVTASLILGFSGGQPAAGGPFTLKSSNSVVHGDTTRQDTIFDWRFDGVPHLRELSNWYRVGASGPERSLHTLPHTVTPVGTNRIDVNYVDPANRFQIDIIFDLLGGSAGSGKSKIRERVQITNTMQTGILDFHFFEYVDLNLTNTPSDDTELIILQNVVQTDPDTMVVTDIKDGVEPHRFEFATYPNTLGKLQDGVPSTLSSLWPPLSVVVPGFGPGDVTWAMQWSFTGIPFLGGNGIPAGESVWFEKWCDGESSVIVPEPAAGVLLALGIPALGWLRRRRSS